MDYRLLRSFLAVAETGSFTRAATAIGVSQPALSAHVRRLEDITGFPLFDRTTRRVTLLPEGNALIARTQALVSAADDLRKDIRRLRDQSGRELRIGTAFFTIDVAERNELLDAYASAHSDVRLTVHDGQQHELVSAVARGRLDAAIVIGVGVSNAAYGGFGKAAGVFPQDLKVASLGRKRVSLIVPKEQWFGSDSVEASWLAGRPVAMIEVEQGAAVLSPLRDFLIKHGAELRYPFEARHAVAVERFAVRQRIAAVALGWFGRSGDPDDTMTRVHISGFEEETECAVLVSVGAERKAVAQFVQFVGRWRKERGRAAGLD